PARHVERLLNSPRMDSDTRRAPAAATTKAQWASSPSLTQELLTAIMDAMAAHQNMAKQALNSETIRARMLAIILGPGALWEALRAQRGFTPPAPLPPSAA
ncbi:MAG: hypothetical protein ACK5WA_01435, partial [Alphaproteobacteria bacterium]